MVQRNHKQIQVFVKPNDSSKNHVSSLLLSQLKKDVSVSTNFTGTTCTLEHDDKVNSSIMVELQIGDNNISRRRQVRRYGMTSNMIKETMWGAHDIKWVLSDKKRFYIWYK
jgi:hypothetical protein